MTFVKLVMFSSSVKLSQVLIQHDFSTLFAAVVCNGVDFDIDTLHCTDVLLGPLQSFGIQM